MTPTSLPDRGPAVAVTTTRTRTSASAKDDRPDVAAWTTTTMTCPGGAARAAGRWLRGLARSTACSPAPTSWPWCCSRACAVGSLSSWDHRIDHLQGSGCKEERADHDHCFV